MKIAERSGRLLATVLFTDIVGSTRLAAEMGDRRWAEVLEAHHAAVREQIERYAGEEMATAGDGFFAIFDSPASAIECARGIRDALLELGLEVRAGVHTGEAEIMGDNVGGLAVHIGARVSAKAGPGQILVSSTVKDLVAGSAIPFKDRGSHTLKGVPGKWRLFAVDDAPPEKPVGAKKGARKPLPGRGDDLVAIEQEMDATTGGALRVITIEGEIGIGKSRLLEEIEAIAVAKRFGVASATADEEIRGPFLLSRALLAGLGRLAKDTAGRRSLKQAVEALSGGGIPEHAAQGASAADRLMPVLDAITLAIRAIALRKPLCLMLDDVQWADDETLRLVRFITRFGTGSPILLVMAFEPGAAGPAALAADLERLRLGRRVELRRLTLDETGEALALALGGKVERGLATYVHEQTEGVPYNVSELVRLLQDSGDVHAIEGTWSLSQSRGTEVPPPVRALVERRAARLPADTREALQIAAVSGRRFALKTLAAVMGATGSEAPSAGQVAKLLAPAVQEGLVVELPATESHDYGFAHNQVRSVFADSLSRGLRTAVHSALVDVITGDGDPPPDRLAEIAYHARLAGEMHTADTCAMAAAKLALDAQSPEEALRLLDTVPVATLEEDRRVGYLRLRDDALASAGLGVERGPVLDELGALARESADGKLAHEVELRRSAAARAAEDWGRAVEIAREARDAARARGDKRAEHAAGLELGQSLLQSPLGEGFTAAPSEIDLDAALETFTRVAELAGELGDRRGVAVACREIGVVRNGLSKAAFLDYAMSKPLFVLPEGDEWAPLEASLERAREALGRALEIFEQLDDRRGVMSTVIALSYTHWNTGIRHGVAGVMEQIRRLHIRGPFMTQTERLEEEMKTLYGIHYFARSTAVPDLALDRGGEAYRAARGLGDRWIEFLAAGGVALTHAVLAERTEAEHWLDLARSAVMADPTPIRARRLEFWRGVAVARCGDVDAAAERLGRAVEMAAANGMPPERCEFAAAAALELSLLAAVSNGKDGNERALESAERFAEEALRLSPSLPGQPWVAEAQAARAFAMFARGDVENAVAAAGAGFWNLEARVSLAPHFEVRLLTMRVLTGAGGPDVEEIRNQARGMLQEVVLNIFDQDVKRRWLASPLHKALEDVVGPVPPPARPSGDGQERLSTLTPRESHVLRLLTSGMTNREISVEAAVPKATVDADVESLFAKLGVTSRAAATRFALREGVV